MERAIRQKLDLITNNPNIASHNDAIKSLLSHSKNTIQVNNNTQAVSIYNCFMFALNLHNSVQFKSIKESNELYAYPNSHFIRYLLQQNYLHIIDKKFAVKGDIVLYFDDEKIKHAGKIHSDNLIISKWGKGNLYIHDTFSVPEKYGYFVNYYKNISEELTVEAYLSHQLTPADAYASLV